MQVRSRVGGRTCIDSGCGLPHTRPHRRQGQPALPRRDDVRRLGQPRPRRLASASSTARSTPASTSSTPPTSTRAASPRRSSARRLRAAGATTSCSRRRCTAPMGERPEPARQLAALDRRGASRTACGGSAPTGSTSTRSTAPTADTDIDETLGALTDLVRAGQDPLLRQLDVPGARDRRGAVGGGAARPRAVRLRAAAVLDARARHRARRAARVPSSTAWASSRGARSPAAGSPDGAARGRRRRRAREPSRIPARYDMSLPENQRKLDAADALAALAEEAGITLVHMAIAFVLRHPAVTAPDRRPAHDGAAREPSRRDRCHASTRRCSTASTRSSRRGRPSTRWTRAGRRRPSPTRRCAAAK